MKKHLYGVVFAFDLPILKVFFADHICRNRNKTCYQYSLLISIFHMYVVVCSFVPSILVDKRLLYKSIEGSTSLEEKVPFEE